MRKQIKKIVILLLTISLLLPFNPFSDESKISAASSSNNPFSIDMLAERFDVTAATIQDYIDQGFTTQDLYAVFYLSQHLDITIEEALNQLYPDEVNLSPNAESTIDDELSLAALHNIPFDAEGEEEGQSEQLLQGENELNSTMQMGTMSSPPLDEPPVYNETVMNQAPYSVGIGGESISSLSGSLSLSQTDLQLPGRNGLSFNLNRKYNTQSAQVYGMEHYGSSYDIYSYKLAVDALEKPLTTNYQVIYDEQYVVEHDYGSDGSIDYQFTLSWGTKVHGTYTTLSQANANKNVTYTVPSQSMTATDSRTSSTNSFPSTVSYNQDGYSGTLSKSGSATVISGSYTPAESKTVTSTCTNKLPGKYNASGQWSATGDYTNSCPNSMPYNSGGFTGTLNRTTTDTIKACASPGPANAICTKEWRAKYSGTVTKPASPDTRVWRQNYSGTVTKPGTSTTKKCTAWQSYSGGRDRYCDVIVTSSIQVVPLLVEGAGRSGKVNFYFVNYSDAYNFESVIKNASAGQLLGTYNNSNYYTVSNPATTITADQVIGTGVNYYNRTVVPEEEKRFPLGKGWSWDLPYVETKSGKRFVHLAGGGSYEVNGTKLKDYGWEGLSFVADNTVTVNGETSQHALVPISGAWKQHFTSDGRLLQISDAYNNTIQFHYATNASYGRKLLSQVKDAIGNTINITYSPTSVVLTSGQQTVTYQKRTEQGVELLESVTDAEGRKTTYSYALKDAKFNLVSSSLGSSALLNPYALLTGIQHPTGAVTTYTYEDMPVTRFIGSSSVNQAYRLYAREDRVPLSNGEADVYNRRNMNYHDKDFGSSFSQDFQFKTTIDDGLSATKYHYKKDYINSSTPSQYYTEKVETAAGGTVKMTEYAYAKKVGSNTYWATAPTTTTHKTNLNTDTVTTSNQYDDYGNVLQMTDGRGGTAVYTYDTTKRLLQSARVQTGTGSFLHTAYTRNPQGDVMQSVTKRQDADGEVLALETYTRDTYGNIQSISVKNGSDTVDTQIVYGSAYQHAFPTMQSVLVTDVNGAQTLHSVQAEYDVTTGQLLAWVDGKNNRTSYQYDRLGRITQVMHPDHTAYAVSYDDIGNSVVATNEAGSQSKTSWNALGLKVEQGIFDASGYSKKARYGYDAYGRNTWVEDAKGNRTRMEYDSWSRVIKTILPDGSETLTAYEDASYEVMQTDATGYAVIETFNKLGERLTKAERKSPTSVIELLESYTYEPIGGQLLKVRDAKQQETSFNYDIFNRLTAVTNAKNETTTYTYDDLGNLIATIYPDGNSRHKEYDELGRLIKRMDEEGRTDTFRYDVNGNLIERTDRKGQIITYQYDIRNRLIQKQGVDIEIGYTYDPTGKRLSMTDVTGTTSYLYDPYTGQLKQTTYADGRTLTLDYDENGNRVQMTGPFGHATHYAYDNLNRLLSVGSNPQEPDAVYSYQLNGLPEQVELANGTSSQYHYSGMQLSGLQYQRNNEQLLSYAYQYDPNKNITGRTQNGEFDLFAYDPLNRIETSSEFDETYSYDARGNRQVLASEQTMVLPSVMENSFDSLDRLIEVKTENGTVVEYRYNGDGLLVERVAHDETTRYYYDGAHIIAEATIVNDQPQFKARYIRGVKMEAVEYAGQNKAFALYNGHGDLIQLQDETGQVLNEYEYDIWGNTLHATETVHNPFRYSGELWDNDTKLQYLRARWYDPSIGRFISEDTYEGQLNDPLSLNLYTYVHNNPLIYVDPTGNWCESADGKYGHWGGCNGGQAGVEIFADYKGSKYTPDEVYAKSQLVNLAYDDFPLWKQIGTALLNDPLSAVENNKDDINRVAAERGISPELIGAIIFREQVSRKDMDLFGSSVGLGAITPRTAREAWSSIDTSMILPKKDSKLRSKLKDDNTFNIETIAVILLYKNQQLGQTVINKTTVAYYNSSMSTADSIAEGNHYADQVYSYMEYIAILLK